MTVRLSPRLALLMTLPPLLWAGNAVVGRLMVGQVPPATLNFLRWLLVAGLLLPLAWRALVPWRRVAARWPYLLAVGVLSVGTFSTLQYLALLTSSPLNITLVAASLPAWTLAVGALFWRVRPRPRELAGAVLGFAGVCVIVGRGSWRQLAAVQWVAGDLYILLATILWAGYSWLLARPPVGMQAGERPAEWDWAGFLLLQTLFGLLASGAATAVEQALGAAPVRWSGGVVAALGYVALGPSIVAYRCWGQGVAEAGPALAAFFNNLTPLFAAVLSAALLGSTPEPYHAAAFALIVGGIAIGTPRSAPPPE